MFAQPTHRAIRTAITTQGEHIVRRESVFSKAAATRRVNSWKDHDGEDIALGCTIFYEVVAL